MNYFFFELSGGNEAQLQAAVPSQMQFGTEKVGDDDFGGRKLQEMRFEGQVQSM